MPLPLETYKAMDIFLEGIYPKSLALGNRLVEVGLKKTQIRKLERVVSSTTRFSEIVNFIKNQAGKEKEGNRKWRVVAENLMAQLAQIEGQAQTLGQGDSAAIMDIKLRLARGWARQVVAHYLYSAPEVADEEEL